MLSYYFLRNNPTIVRLELMADRDYLPSIQSIVETSISQFATTILNQIKYADRSTLNQNENQGINILSLFNGISRAKLAREKAGVKFL